MLKPLCRPLYAWGSIQGTAARRTGAAETRKTRFPTLHSVALLFFHFLFPYLLSFAPFFHRGPAYSLLRARKGSKEKAKNSSRDA